MWRKWFLWLDDKQWPQRLVGWALKRRVRSRLSQYLFPLSSATHAVSLSVGTPLIAAKDLYEGVIPHTFGCWRDYKVRQAMTRGNIAVAILEELRSGTEFSLVAPVHADFDHRRFLRARLMRLTCEAERSRLVTVRETNGRLLAAGTVELVPTAAYSRELRA